MLARKAAKPVEGHVERITTDSNGDCHLEQEDGDAVFVPGLIGIRLGVRFGRIQEGPHNLNMLRCLLCLFHGEPAGQEAVFFRMALVSRGPEIEQREWQK